MGSQPSCCKSKEPTEADMINVEDQQQWDIFFSHKQSEAQDAAQNIIKNLERLRPAIKVWVDLEQNPTEEGMMMGVKNSQALLFYITEGIGFSKYCIQELAWAVEFEKKIILMVETDTRHHAVEVGVIRDRMPDNVKHVFDSIVAIPFYRDPEHKEVSLKKILDALDGKDKKAHGAMARQSFTAGEQVKIASAACGFRSATEAVPNAYRKLMRQLRTDKGPQLVICNYTCNYDSEQVVAGLKKAVDSDTAVLGCTSSAGVMVDQTWHSQENYGFGMWGIYDPEGTYVVAHAVELKDLKSACQNAVKKAAKDTAPDFIITFPHPGCEEQCLAEIKSVLGKNVPVIGGSSADNSVAGEWRQISSENGVSSAGFVFAMCWPSVLCHAGFCSGFNPTESSGKITKLHDKRHIATINGEKAAVIYDRWSGGKFTELMKEKEDSNILAASTYTPLSVQYGKDSEGEPMYVVIHPHLIKKEDMSLTLFKNVEEGQEIICLAGTKQNLISRLSKVVKDLLKGAPFKEQDVIGSYQIFCGGVMMAIKDNMPIVSEKLGEVLGWTTSMGACTFGEQGTFIDGTPGHGNLMFASIVFSRIKKSSTSAKSFGGGVVLQQQT